MELVFRRHLALERDATRARHIDNAERLYHAHKALDFVGIARAFDYQRSRIYIDNLRAEEIGNLHDFGTRFGIGFDLDHHKLARNKRIDLGKVFDLYHIDELLELLYALFNAVAPLFYRDGNAGVLAAHERTDIESFDIEPPAAEHSRDTREDAEFVFNKSRYCMIHKRQVKARRNIIARIKPVSIGDKLRENWHDRRGD